MSRGGDDVAGSLFKLREAAQLEALAHGFRARDLSRLRTRLDILFGALSVPAAVGFVASQVLWSFKTTSLTRLGLGGWATLAACVTGCVVVRHFEGETEAQLEVSLAAADSWRALYNDATLFSRLRGTVPLNVQEGAVLNSLQQRSTQLKQKDASPGEAYVAAAKQRMEHGWFGSDKDGSWTVAKLN